MKKYISLWIGLCCVLFAQAQTITITDSVTKAPLASVALISENPVVFATTNNNGQTDVSAFKGASRIVLRILGYKTIAMSYDEMTQQDFAISMSPTQLNLEEVVVSATRWRQDARDIPAKIESIKPRDIALLNPQTAADMLGNSGSVYIQKSQQGGGSPMIRGFATNRLLYTVDGVRMNTAIFRSGNLQNVINIDPFATEGTEVLFGPGSVIYGSDAIGGVMSVKTLTPELSYSGKRLVKGKGLVRFASANNERTGHFDVNVGWKKWAIVSSFSTWDFDDLRQGRFGPSEYVKPYYVSRSDGVDHVVMQEDPLVQNPSAYAQMNMMQKVRYKPNKHWDIEYGFHYSETSPYGRYDRHNRVRNGLPRYAEWQYGPQKWQMNLLTVDYEKSNALFDRATLRAAHQVFEESRITRSFNSNTRTTNGEKVFAYSANLDFIKSLGKKHTLFYGAEYVFNDVHSKGLADNIVTGGRALAASRYPQASWSSAALYVSEEYKPSRKWTFQTGLRISQFALAADFDTSFYSLPFTEASLNDYALTGSFGAVYKPNTSWTLSANFGTAFRAPNVDDMGKVFDSEPGAVVVPNPGLTAEYAYNIDAGIAKTFGGRLKIDATVYYTVLENALVRRDYQLNGLDSITYLGELSKVQAIQNAAVANVYGVQAGFEWVIRGGFRLSSNINYQVGEEELDDGTVSPSRHAAPLFGMTRFTYKIGQLMLQMYSTYQGERSFSELPVGEQSKTEIYAMDANGNPYAPAWYTLNFKAMHQLSKTLNISAGVENITDQRYRTYSSGISAPGRNVVMSLTAQF